jgi:hypothetical protein
VIGGFLRRALLMTSGFLIAVSVGALFLPFAALFDPAIRELGLEAVAAGFFQVFNAAMAGATPDFGLPALFCFFSVALLAVCVAPLALVALIGEAAGAKSWVWYAAASGLLAAASPWIARGAAGLSDAHRVNPLELRFVALFFLTGALTGFVYWLIAARRGAVED